MKIAPPLGYEQVTPLLKNHKVLLPRAEETPAIFHRLHAMPLSLSEFEPACRDYPIVFVSGDDGDTFNAMVVLGMQVKQNLFILTDGMWDRRTYLPAYVRRYPFCMSRVTVDGEPQNERIVCIEESALHDSGEPLHDVHGQAALAVDRSGKADPRLRAGPGSLRIIVPADRRTGDCLNPSR